MKKFKENSPRRFYDDKKTWFFHMGHTLKKLIKQNYYSEKENK